MNFRDLFFVAVFVAVADALRCKCTQSSAKTTCEAGICSVPSGESACLALDHPKSGLYYACSQTRLPHGRCSEKLTKSGVTVRVCSCDNEDFCNARMWPTDDSPAQRDDSAGAAPSANGAPLPLLSLPALLSSFLVLLLRCW